MRLPEKADRFCDRYGKISAVGSVNRLGFSGVDETLVVYKILENRYLNLE